MTPQPVTRSNAGACSPAPAGGTSGHLSSTRPFTFGTIRVRARYFPGSAALVSYMVISDGDTIEGALQK